MEDRLAECLDDATIAAMLDGRLWPAEQASGEAHLASCERCYQLFASTARFLSDEAAPAVPGRTSRYFRIALPAAAVILVGAAGAWFRPIPGAGPASVSLPTPRSTGLADSGAAAPLLVASIDTRRLEEGCWLTEGSAYAFTSASDRQRAAVLLGAAKTDHAVASRAGREREARELARRIADLQDAHAPALEPGRVAFGEWLEAARLAALARDAKFLEDPRVHRVFEDAPRDLTAPQKRALAAARALLVAPRAVDRDWVRLASALMDALLV
jgi:hypothetical protein